MPITETISYPAHDTIQRTVNGKTIFTSTEHVYEGKVVFEQLSIRSIESVTAKSESDTPSFSSLSVEHEISKVTTTGTTDPRVGEVNQVTLEDGEPGQEKNVVLFTKGHVDDTLKIIPNNGITITLSDEDANVTLSFISNEWISKNVGSLVSGVIGDIDGGIF